MVIVIEMVFVAQKFRIIIDATSGVYIVRTNTPWRWFQFRRRFWLWYYNYAIAMVTNQSMKTTR